jgi:hypothetical protein
MKTLGCKRFGCSVDGSKPCPQGIPGTIGGRNQWRLIVIGKVGVRALSFFLICIGMSSVFASQHKTRSLESYKGLAKYGGELIAQFDNMALEMMRRNDQHKDALMRLHREAERLMYSQFYGSQFGDAERLSLEKIDDLLGDQLWNIDGPSLIKILVSSDGEARVVGSIQSLIIARGEKTFLPLIIRNEVEEFPYCWVTASWPSSTTPTQDKREFGVPPSSIRGYLLPIPANEVGTQIATLSLQLGNRVLNLPLSLDVRNEGKLRVRLSDELGNAIAARCYVTGADGLAYVPDTKLQYVTHLGGEYYFYADGGFEVELPAGTATIQIVIGPEFEPLKTDVQVVAARRREIHLTPRRWINMSDQGWYSGDVHIHANLISNDIISPSDVFLATRAEDLNVANVLISNSLGSWLHDTKYFREGPNALSAGHHILYYNEETTSAKMYGHMALLNLKKLVEPPYTGWDGTPNAEDYPANYTLALKAHEQGGVVSYEHPGSTDPGALGGSAYELPVDVALGQVDAMEVFTKHGDDALVAANLWYRLLNCGFKLPASAGTDAALNFTDTFVPGGSRVYVQVGSEFRYDTWIEGYRAGRSFATNGPLLNFKVNDKDPGSEIQLPLGQSTATVNIFAKAVSIAPMDRLEVVVNGKVVETAIAAEGERSLLISRNIGLSESSWVAVRVLGPSNRLVVNQSRLFAHSSPVYCYVRGKPIASKSDAIFFVNWINELIRKVEMKGTFSNIEHKDEVIALFRTAQRVYEQKAQNVN